MKVAIVCDWLTGLGGAERVVYEFHTLYPKAPIYTSQYNDSIIDWSSEVDVRTTWLQRLPAKLKKFLPVLRMRAFKSMDLSGYDLVLSSSGAEAKAVKTGPKTTHICYCHSPTHYYWIRHDEYLDKPGFPLGFNWLAKVGLKVLVGSLKHQDRKAAQGPDYMIANSTYTQNNIKRFYGRDSVVIHPPVDVDRFKIKGTPPLRHGFVIAGRQTPYKRIDLAIEACNELKVPLVVIGDGPDHRRLERIAGRSITFLTNVSDNDMAEHFQTALGFILPNSDDFGIVAVEAMAAGTPVVAYNKGGALDYLVPNKTGLFFEKQTVKSLAAALEACMNKSWDNEAIAEHAQSFSIEAFKKQMKTFIKACLKERGA